MIKVHFAVGRLASMLVILLLANNAVKGQTTNKTITLGANVGSFSYTVTSTLYDCTDAYTYTEYDFDNMVYTSVDGVQHQLAANTYSTHSTTTHCPSSVGPTITYNGSGYTLVIRPTVGGSLIVTVTVPGYVNPKYVVAGVTYAPPGPQSFVNYGNSTLVSNTSSLSNSFSNTYTVTVKLGSQGGIYGWLSGSQSNTSSTSWGQETDTSSSL